MRKVYLLLIAIISASMLSYASTLTVQIENQTVSPGSTYYADCSKDLNIVVDAHRSSVNLNERVTWRLYKNNELVYQHQSKHFLGNPDKKYQGWTRIHYPASSGTYWVSIKIEEGILGKWNTHYTNETYSFNVNTSSGISSSNPTASFTINGGATNICEVSNITMNASASSCEDRYKISIGNKSTDWFVGTKAPSSINLRSIAAGLGVSLAGGTLHTVKLTVSNGSISRSASSSIRILKNVNPKFTNSLNSVCVSSTQTISVTNIAGASYSWSFSPNISIIGSPSANTRTISINGGTSANATVSIGNICNPKTITTATDVQSGPPIELINEILGNETICTRTTDNTFSVSGILNATSYEWSVSGGIGIQGNGHTVTVLGYNSGTATITVIGKNVCGETTPASKTINVISCFDPCSNPGLRIGQPSPALSISPNPVRVGQEVSVQRDPFAPIDCLTPGSRMVNTIGTSSTITQIVVHNAMGQQVLELQPEQWANGQVQFSTAGFRAGVHFIKIHTAQGALTRRFMVIE